MLIYVANLESAALVYTLLSLLPCLLLVFLVLRYSHSFDSDASRATSGHSGGNSVVAGRRHFVWALTHLGLWAFASFVLLSHTLITLGIAAAASREQEYAGHMVAGGAVGLWLSNFYWAVYLEHQVNPAREGTTIEDEFVQAVFGDKEKAMEAISLHTYLVNVAVIPLILGSILELTSVPSINTYGLIGGIILLLPLIVYATVGTVGFLFVFMLRPIVSWCRACLTSAHSHDVYVETVPGTGGQSPLGTAQEATLNPLFQ